MISGTDDILAGHESLWAGQEALCQDLHQHPEPPHAEHRTAGLPQQRRSPTPGAPPTWATTNHDH